MAAQLVLPVRSVMTAVLRRVGLLVLQVRVITEGLRKAGLREARIRVA